MYRTIAITISVLAIASAIYTFVTKSDLSTSITLCVSALVFFLLGVENIRSKHWKSGLLFICTSMLILGVAIQLVF
ncbi:hypothetical protein NDQ53_01625 [Rossellomorea marisflavi]|uniref:hypothetical protein n=1 Tax=Rossellomorea marisflavi TaxID=189381 RepID=UPI00203CF136|nr:hypothetical protein [Rossellomorea marisflavi]MCM2588000.1 hypothetical protein [Rossellomorea marisflavi]